MRTSKISPRLTLALSGGFLLAATGMNFMSVAHAAPARRLEIWPGQRALLVLPLSIGTDWNAAPELGQAILPVVSSELQRALGATQKFSITLPYRFDPVLRRAVIENRLTDDEVTSLLQTPTLDTAQPIMAKLGFDQAAMIADVKLEELRIGGTQRSPTAQLQVSGKLYESGKGLFRSVVVTSKAFGGRTPEARLTAAARDAFTEMAQKFVEAPESFQLPMPVSKTKEKPVATPVVATPVVTPAPTLPVVAPVMPSSTVPVQPPGSLAPAAGTLFIPQLPVAQPPLGLNVTQEPVVR